MRFISALRDVCSRSSDHSLSEVLDTPMASNPVVTAVNSSERSGFSMRRLARVRPSVVLTVTALVVPCLLLVGYGQTGRRNNPPANSPRAANITRFSEGSAEGIPGVSLKVDRGTDAMTVYVGQIPKPMAGFSGKLEGSPATTAECRLGGADRNTSWASPKWVWTYDLQGGPEGNGSGGSYSPTPPAPTPAPGVTPTPTPAVTPKPTPDNGSPSGGAYLSFTQPGTYTITATANLTYSASCVEGEMPDTTSTSATSLPITITVLPAPTPTPTPEGGTTDGGTTDGGTTDGGTTDGGTTDGGTTDGGTTDGGTTDGGTTDGGTTDGGTTDGGTTDGGGTTGGDPGACELDPYKHATWTDFGTLTWTTDADGKLQPSVTGWATEMRTAFGQSPRYDQHGYEQIADYPQRVNGILRRFVRFRADATCSTNLTESTWLSGSIALEDVPSGKGFGSASLMMLKQLEDNTTEPKLPTQVFKETKEDVEGQVFVALDLSSSGANEGQATIRLKETKNGLAETESHIDVPISLSNADGWQKFYDPDKDDPQGDGPKEEAWWPAPEGPQGEEGHYRYLLPWSTADGPWAAQRIVFDDDPPAPNPDGTMVAGKLWNHNGGHKVSLSSVNKKETSKLTFGSGTSVESFSVSDTSLTIANSNWDDLPAISGGEIRDSSNMADPEVPTTLYVQAGGELSCLSNNALDKDSYWGDDNNDGVQDESEVQFGTDTLTYAWSAPAGTFDSTTGSSVKWTAPKTLGDVTLTCVIDDKVRQSTDKDFARDDAPLTRTVIVKVLPVYLMEWDDAQTDVAIGSKPTLAHQGRFTVTVKDGDGNPMPNYAAPKIEIISGGRGRGNTPTAKTAYDNNATTVGVDGQLKGTFLSGERGESTVIGILNKAETKKSGVAKSISIDQIWNGLPSGNGPDKRWEYSEYYYYNQRTPVTYRLAIKRNGVFIPITSHSFRFEARKITAWVWNPAQGPLGGYDYITYTGADLNAAVNPTISRTPNSFFVWDSNPHVTPSATTQFAEYKTGFNAEYNEDFVLDTITFYVVDEDAFDNQGAN